MRRRRKTRGSTELDVIFNRERAREQARLRQAQPPDEHLYTYRVVEVLRVIDGDTVDVAASLGFGIRVSFRFRLLEVNTAEVYGPKASEEGQQAKAFTADWLDGRQLLVETYKSSQATVGIGDGAFGRWLADFIDAGSGERLTDALREAGFA